MSAKPNFGVLKLWKVENGRICKTKSRSGKSGFWRLHPKVKLDFLKIGFRIFGYRGGTGQKVGVVRGVPT